MKTTKKQPGGVTGRGFQPGQSGNPGGRPKSLASQILERRPTTSRDLIDFWCTVAFGTVAAIRKKYGSAPELRDRQKAAIELANRLHGSPVQTHEISGPGGGAIPLRAMSDQQLELRIAGLERQLRKART